jgi:twitching motility protein PilT
MTEIRELLELSVQERASDIFIGAGRNIAFKIDGTIVLKEERITADESEKLVMSLYVMGRRDSSKLEKSGDDDFSVAVPGLARFRVSALRQRGTLAAVIRVVLFSLPDYKKLGIPDEVMKITSQKHGIALVTGPAGSGKTTTLACIIDEINMSRNNHIITLEDPIEYLHRDKKSLITQREVSLDTDSYLTALRACLRQAPDIVLLGEMRDYETIQTAMTAAETGHLIISTLHTVGAVNTIDRIVDVFPPGQQQQIRVQLSMLLNTVVTQRLIPSKSGLSVPAFEIMHVNSAIRNLIRESKTHQIDNTIQTSSGEGMVSMDAYINKLYQNGVITGEAAISHATNPDQMAKRVAVK